MKYFVVYLHSLKANIGMSLKQAPTHTFRIHNSQPFFRDLYVTDSGKKKSRQINYKESYPDRGHDTQTERRVIIPVGN